jgi:hypothetical protein
MCSYTAVHCVSQSEVNTSNKNWNTLPYVVQYVDDDMQTLEYTVVSRCMFEDETWNQLKPQLLPGNILRENSIYNADNVPIPTSSNQSLTLNPITGNCVIEPLVPVELHLPPTYPSPTPIQLLTSCQPHSEDTDQSVAALAREIESFCNDLVQSNSACPKEEEHEFSIEACLKSKFVLHHVWHCIDKSQSLTMAVALGYYQCCIHKGIQKRGADRSRFMRLKGCDKGVKKNLDLFCSTFNIQPSADYETLVHCLSRDGKSLSLLQYSEIKKIGVLELDITRDIVVIGVDGIWFSASYCFFSHQKLKKIRVEK